MNTAIISGTDTFSGIGFAIPTNTITKIVPSLIEKGSYTHPYLGLSGATLTSDLAQNLTGIPSAVANLKGIYIQLQRTDLRIRLEYMEVPQISMQRNIRAT